MPRFELTLLLIPVIAGIIGLATNWLAVRMLFWPIEPSGWGPFRWQGIVPARARKMAAIAVDTGISKLGTVPEIAEYFDPDRIAEHLTDHLDPLVPELIEQLAQDPDRRRLWAALPPRAKALAVQRVRDRLPAATHRLLRDVADNIEDLVDVRMMVVDLMGGDRPLVVEMFRSAGAREFRFLVWSGLGFGATLGLPQMLGAWLLPDLVPPQVALPLAGLAVGYVTNWLALRLIFEPVEPRRYFGVTVQGLFLRRQQQVSEVYCHLVTRRVLTLRNFIDRMLTGPRSDRTHALVHEHVGALVDEAMGAVRPAVELAVGRDEIDELEDDVERSAVVLSSASLDDPAFNAERAAAVEHHMLERMSSLSPEEFSGMLRPVFEEDETTLALVGAALGGVAGILQALLLF